MTAESGIARIRVEKDKIERNKLILLIQITQLKVQKIELESHYNNI